MDLIFVQSLSDICQHSFVSPGRPLHCTIIVNPAAGGFSIASKWKSNSKIMNEYRQKAQANPQRPIHKSINMVITEGKGCGGKIVKELVTRIERDSNPFYLIISAGGDGTHHEIMFAVYNMPAHVRSHLAVLRLPMGTGNDGSDGSCMEDALDLLIKPVHVEFAPAVQLITASGGQAGGTGLHLAFNILSIGLDAYVTHMTNKMKGKVPGDSYKLWVDIAAVFYDRFYKVGYMDVRALDQQNQEILSYKEKVLLLAMGASGRRTYGSRQKILPDDRNVCGIRQMPLHRKLAIKGKVLKGTHTDSPESRLFNAHRIEFSGSYPILAQMDGETILLKQDDFPATMELTAPVIPVLKM